MKRSNRVDEIERISVTSLKIKKEQEDLEQQWLQQEVGKLERLAAKREERSPGTAYMNNVVQTNNGDSTSDLFEDPSTKNVKVRVALRIRPLIKREMLENTVSCVLDDEQNNEIIIGRGAKQRRFTYDYVLGPHSNQQNVYDRCHVASLVDGCFHGYNATIFAYGQTGSGKTYTMGSSSLPENNRNSNHRHHVKHTIYEDDSISNSLIDENNHDVNYPSNNYDDDSALNLKDPSNGILPRVAKRLFDKIANNNDVRNHSANSRKLKYTVRMTFIEIHKEKVRDLLRPDVGPERVAVRDDGKGGIRVSGLKPIVLKSELDLMKHVNRGCILRTTGKTLMNDRSSRSHALITLMLEQEYDLTEEEIQQNKLKRRKKKGKKKRGRFNNHLDKDGGISEKRPGYRCAKLHIVDLAGSERQKRTGAVGNRFQESVRINQGLLALGNVISALGDPRKSRRKHHVPYRESKLTRLLQDSLGGNSQTLMIACVTPALNSLEETLNVLKYANRARNIKNKAKVNVEPELPEVSDDDGDDSLTEEGDLNEETEDEIMVQDLELEKLHNNDGSNPDLMLLKKENTKMNQIIILHEQEKMQVQLELQKCQDELMNVKNDLVSSEARVSFLYDQVQRNENEVHDTKRERDQLEQALIDARKDLERDEVIFAEKMSQMAELQKKATKFYVDKKELKEQIILLKTKLKKTELALATSMASTTAPTTATNLYKNSNKNSNLEEMDDIGIQTSLVIEKVDKFSTESQDIGVQTLQIPKEVDEGDVVVQDIEEEDNHRVNKGIKKQEGVLKGDISSVKRSIKFVSTGLIKKTTSDEDDDDEVTIMIGEESFAAVNNSLMAVNRIESGKENVVPPSTIVATNKESSGETSNNMSSQRSRIEVSSSSAQLTAAWLEDVTDKFVQRNEDKEFLMNKTARLRVLNNERKQAALALRSSMTNNLGNDSKNSSQQNSSNLDSELLENHLEALEVEVEVETAAVNDLQNTMTNDPKVGLADIYAALDDLEEGEARALLRRCCSRMAKLKRDRGKYEVEMNKKNMKIQAQCEQLAALEMTLHQSSIEYDRRLREQRQKYEAKMGVLLRRSLTSNRKPVTVRMSRKQLKEINPFERREFV